MPITSQISTSGKTFFPPLQSNCEAQVLWVTLYLGNAVSVTAPKRQKPPNKDISNRYNLVTLQAAASTSPIPDFIPQERLLEHPQVRTLLTISNFGCFGAFLQCHRAPGERCPPPDGAQAGGELQQRGLSFIHF